MLIPPGGAPRPHSAELLPLNNELKNQDELSRQQALTAAQLRDKVFRGFVVCVGFD